MARRLRRVLSVLLGIVTMSSPKGGQTREETYDRRLLRMLLACYGQLVSVGPVTYLSRLPRTSL